MATTHEEDYKRRVTDVQTRFLPGSNVEIVREVDLKKPPLHAVFDFDGTLSLVREGWPDIMIPMLVDELVATGTRETRDELKTLVTNFVNELTGKQTIYQMFRLVEEIEKRGGRPEDPAIYKHRYHEQLMARIEGRRQGLHNGTIPPEEMLVPGSLRCLEALQERGVVLYLASGTDENYVREEADLLGLTTFFREHIYGAKDDYKAFSKQMVIERILRENSVKGDRLIGFGDGYVEIDNIKGAGGTAVGVASDEASRSGRPDPWKRDRLIGVGADIIVPDFQEIDTVCKYLWKE